MSPRPFLDTNVLVYALTSDDSREETAKAIVGAGGIISVQVLNEFVAVLRRKLRRDWGYIDMSLQALRRVLGTPVALTDETHTLAADLSRRYDFSIYDSLILSAAKLAGCRLLYTEDLGMVRPSKAS
jgi:predicted nucleic acid-binding protein